MAGGGGIDWPTVVVVEDAGGYGDVIWWYWALLFLP